MEIANSPMNERQRTYRQVYRDRIAAWYNGYLHIAIIYAIGFCALYVYLSHLENVQWWEWLVVPVVFLASNIFEWWLHTQVMHRPRKWKGSSRHLHAPHAHAPPVLHQRRNAVRRPPRLAGDGVPALCASWCSSWSRPRRR